MIWHNDPQGSDAWLEARRGVITASRAKDARDTLKGGKPSQKSTLYAMDCAREMAGGRVLSPFANAAMRMGTEEEPAARMAYEAETGNLVEEAGFVTTDDSLFGCSVDGLVGTAGMIEIKTMVSSDTLFTAAVFGDHSAYIDQINFCMWVLGLKWCDLVLWAPDLEPIGRHLTIVRIHRNDDHIEQLEADMMAFAKRVSEYRAALTAPANHSAEVAA